jgi:hypothetical protein
MKVGAVDETKNILAKLNDNDGLVFKPLFDSSLLEAALHKHAPEFRDRCFPPDVTLSAFCSQMIDADRACRKALSRINVDRAALGLPKSSDSTSGYCQARDRLPLEMIKELALSTSKILEANTPNSWLLNGRHAKLIDGTTLLAADTAENQLEWPQHGKQTPGVGFPILRAVGLFSLANGSICNFAFGPYKGKGTGEMSLARQLIDSIDEGDIILGDRYYNVYFFMAEILEKGADIITRVHGSRKTDFREGKRLGPGDHVIDLVKPPKPKWMTKKAYDSMPKTIKCREVLTDYTDEDGNQVVISTTLVDPKKYSRTELAATYKLRWTVELDLRSLKSTMGMDFLKCQKPEMVKKEIWTYILAYNLIRGLIQKAADKYGLEPNQLSFTAAIQTFNAYAPMMPHVKPDRAQYMFNCMLETISNNRVGNRPGRKEPRAKKMRPQNTTYLKVPRNTAKKACR